jgi:hypothetical protein
MTSSANTYGTIAARMLLRVVDFTTSRFGASAGHERGALLDGLGLDLASLADPEARVPYATLEQVGERALALTRDENFGLHLAQDVQKPEAFDAGVLLLMASPTVGVALERMARYQRYWGDDERASLVRLPEGLAVRYLLPGARGAYARHSDECAMAEIALGVRFLAGASLVARAVRFRHAPPRDTREHAMVFGCSIAFDAAHTEIVFDDHVLEARMPHANEVPSRSSRR